MTDDTAPKIYQLKVTLTGIRPPIWRTLWIPSTMGLDVLHQVLQTAMGWTDSHLHQFVSGRTFYSAVDEYDEFGMEAEDESRYTIAQLLQKEKDSILYEYDFGDDWQHRIVLEKTLPLDGATPLPKCIKGRRACPPEDCGGVWGYQNLLEVLKDPGHSEYDDMLEWVGGGLDPERFDVREINAMLAKFAA